MNIKVIGHRGGGHPEAENSLASIEQGIQRGVHMVELDIQLNNGELYCFHDRRSDSTLPATLYKGLFSELKSNDLQQLNIPTLDDACNLIDNRVGLNIEIKSYGIVHMVVNVVNQLLTRGWSKENILISSFNHEEMFRLRTISHDINIGLIYEGVPFNLFNDVQHIRPTSIHSSIDFVTDNFISLTHQLGLKHYVYTVNEKDDVQRMIQMNVDGIFTDFPLSSIETINQYIQKT